MIADKIMNCCWGYFKESGFPTWDVNSPAHKFWKKEVKKKKRSTLWWKKNWARIFDKSNTNS
jgi:hypothetical protein